MLFGEQRYFGFALSNLAREYLITVVNEMLTDG